jgi:hypothetical protein
MNQQVWVLDQVPYLLWIIEDIWNRWTRFELDLIGDHA